MNSRTIRSNTNESANRNQNTKFSFRREILSVLIMALIICVSNPVHAEKPDEIASDTGIEYVSAQPNKETFLTLEEQQWLLQYDGQIRIGITVIPPQVLQIKGEYKGLSIDYIRLLERKLGYRFELVPYATWNEVIQAAKDRRIDVIFAAQMTPERLTYLLFTDPYIELPNIILVRKDRQGQYTLQDMKDWSIATSEGSAVHEYLKRQFSDLDLKPVPDELTGLMKVSLGEVDAMVVEISRASYYIEQNGILNLRVAGDAGLLYQLRFAIRNDWPILNDILDKGLSAISEQERHEINRRWIIVESKSIFNNRAFLITVGVGIGVLLLVVMTVITWNYSLQKIVKQRTSQLQEELAEREKAEKDLHQLNLELRASEKKSQSLIRKVQTAIVVHNGQGHILDSNPLAHQLLGLSSDQLLGKSLIDPEWHFLREDGSVMPVEEYPVSLVLSKQQPLTNYVTGIHRPEREDITWALVNAEPEYDDTGQITQIIVSFVDITKRKQTEQNLSLMNFALNNVHEAAFLIDEHARFHFVNEESCRILGYTREELLDMGVPDIDPDFPAERWSGHWNDLIRQRSLTFEGRHQTKDGRIFPVEISANYIEYAGMVYNLALVRDISERKQNEEALCESEKQVRRKLDAILSPDVDISELELSDVIDTEKLQGLMNEFYRLTNIGIGIIDLQGNVLVGTGWQDICTKFHRIHPETSQLCIESDLELSRNVQPGTFKLYHCKLNMWDIATPIMLGNKHVGNIFLGQFLFDDEVPDYEVFRQQAHKYGFNEQEYIAALDRVPRWNRKTVDAVMSFYSAFAGMIGEMSYNNIKLANTLEISKRSEQILQRLNRELMAIRECNQALLRAEDEQILVNDICQIVCDKAGYYVVWVGISEYDENKTIRPVAWAGEGSEYIANTRLSWSESSKYGQGLAGKTIRSGQTIYVQDFQTDPSILSWREEARRHGYGSGVGIPLKNDKNEVFGVFMIYSSEVNVFIPKEINLLQELAGDLAYGIIVQRIRAENKKIEEQLRESKEILQKSEDLLNASQHLAKVGGWEYDIKSGKSFWSEELYRLHAIPNDPAIDHIKESLKCYRPEDQLIIHEAFKNACEKGEPYDFEFPFTTYKGDCLWIRTVTQPIYEKGKVVRLTGTLMDITDRKKNEAVNAMRLHLIQFSFSHSLDELLEETLNGVEEMANSLISFYHFVEEDQKTLSLQNWSTRTKAEFCKAEGKGTHYPIEQAGVWVDCVQQRKAVIHNDYASLPHRKGMREGHAPVIRELVVPVFRGENIVAILGIGNKPTDYTEKDVEIITLIANLTWDIVERKRAEEKLQQNFNELQRWHDVTLNREERIQELKREVNQLLKRLNEPTRYESQPV